MYNADLNEKHEDYVRRVLGKAKKGEKIRARERIDLEFKETFDLRNTSKYAKTMAAFSNNRGGYILFGIKDKPRAVCGVNKAFDSFPIEKFSDALNSMFSPEMIWESGIISFSGFEIGYLYTEESDNKPIIALKSDNAAKIQSGDIFYRYRGRSEKIKYPEMSRIIAEKMRGERERIMKLMEAIRNNDTTKLGIVDYSRGSFSTPYGTDIEVDRKLVIQVLRKAKYIKEGSFNETTGTPVLRVTGNIDLAEEIPVPDLEPEIQYPYIQKQLAEKLGIGTQMLYALIWYYHMKGQKKYHMGISTSSSGTVNTHKFSETALSFLATQLDQHKSDKKWLRDIYDEYIKGKRKNPDGRIA